MQPPMKLLLLIMRMKGDNIWTWSIGCPIAVEIDWLFILVVVVVISIVVSAQVVPIGVEEPVISLFVPPLSDRHHRLGYHWDWIRRGALWLFLFLDLCLLLFSVYLLVVLVAFGGFIGGA